MKTMFIGRTGSGKTTLIQAINDEELIYRKTQMVKYHDKILDTPGEYFENKRFHNVLLNLSFKYDMIVFIQSSIDTTSLFPPNFSKMFGNKKVIGVVTKVDLEGGDISRSREFLEKAGVEEIFEISSFTKLGLDSLKNLLEIKEDLI